MIFLCCSPADLLHFKSGEIAEQMTLIDAELFQRIEVRLSWWFGDQLGGRLYIYIYSM